MARIKLVVAYDGTRYHGWQIQNNGITIEEVLNKTLSEMLNEDIKVIGASRTDAGVHALGNVAVFDTESRIPGEKFAFALNTRLPEDIRIQESCRVADDFHPRFADTVKTYEYCILNSRFPNPLKRFYSTFNYYPMDVDKMNEAASYLVGEHDFKSFCTVGAQVLTTVRTIYDLSITKDGDMVKIRITGNGFLYNMVRIISGTLMQVGTGLLAPEDVKDILDAKDRSKAGPTAEAKGLTLVEIRYSLKNQEKTEIFC